jgi:hypothetical protein
MKPELTNQEQELVDRYIFSVKIGLPPDKVDDIAAEIRSNLQSLLEDQAMELRRDLRPEEVSAILKQHGHPMVVANRYRNPGRALISPDLFTFYWFTLRAIFGLWVTVRVIIAVFQFQGSATAGLILLRLGRDILLAGFIIAAGVTLLFAVWEYLEFKFRYSERWRPESLPPVRQPPKPPKPRPVVQITGGVVWIIFGAMALFLPEMYWVWGGRGVFSVRGRLRDAAAHVAAGAGRNLSVVVELYALRRSRVAAVSANRRERRGNSAGGLPAARRRFTCSRSELGSHTGQVAGDSESDGRGVLVLACIVAGLLCGHELRGFIRKSGRRLGRDRQAA